MVQHADIDHTGITGVGGSVATDAIWDAKGDLAVGTGSNTAQRLAVGANHTMPIADSSQTTGLKYIQVLRGVINSDGTIAQGTGFAAAKNSTGHYTITPTNAFVAAPVVIVSVTSGSRIGFEDDGNTTTNAAAKIRTTNLSGTDSDSPFHFILMEP